MSILAAAPVLLFALGCGIALAVLAHSGRKAIRAWGELGRALTFCDDVRQVRITYRPQLRLVEGGLSPRLAATDHGLREAA